MGSSSSSELNQPKEGYTEGVFQGNAQSGREEHHTQFIGSCNSNVEVDDSVEGTATIEESQMLSQLWPVSDIEDKSKLLTAWKSSSSQSTFSQTSKVCVYFKKSATFDPTAFQCDSN